MDHRTAFKILVFSHAPLTFFTRHTSARQAFHFGPALVLLLEIVRRFYLRFGMGFVSFLSQLPFGAEPGEEETGESESDQPDTEGSLPKHGCHAPSINREPKIAEIAAHFGTIRLAAASLTALTSPVQSSGF